MTDLSDRDVPEFPRQRKHPEQFYLAQCGLQQLVVRCHGFMCDVVVAGDTAKFCDLWKEKKSILNVVPLPTTSSGPMYGQVLSPHGSKVKPYVVCKISYQTVVAHLGHEVYKFSGSKLTK